MNSFGGKIQFCLPCGFRDARSRHFLTKANRDCLAGFSFLGFLIGHLAILTSPPN